LPKIGAGQQCLELSGWQRFGVAVALGHTAPNTAQVDLLLAGLDALGDCLEAQCSGQTDDGTGDGAVIVLMEM
jgi:hypothetical protein